MTASLSSMIEEVKDIAESHGWEYHIFEREFPENSGNREGLGEKVYGIVFSPPKCETVTLCFLFNGKMCNPFMFDRWLRSKDALEKRLMFGNFTKTQYAGAEIHKIIVNLFRYLSKKYFKIFSVIDESNYWETNDEQVLFKSFAEWEALIDGFGEPLGKMERKGKETVEESILGAAKAAHKGKGT